jgi:hypothetical protein
LFEIVGDVKESHGPNTALGFVSHPGVLSLSIEAAELLEVSAIPKKEPLGALSFYPRISGLYKVTSRNPTYFNWVALDGRRDEDYSYLELLSVLVCEYLFEETLYDEYLERMVLSHEYVYYFLLLQKTHGSSHSYRRVGVGASSCDSWFKNHSKKMLINIE